jgi:hypothetical protein
MEERHTDVDVVGSTPLFSERGIIIASIQLSDRSGFIKILRCAIENFKKAQCYELVR